MKCKCGEDMDFVAAYDNPDVGYAYNLSQCMICGVVIKEDVWDNKGELLIELDGSTIDNRE